MYSELFVAYGKAFPSKTKQICQSEVNQKWNSIKNDTNFPIKYSEMLKDLKSVSLKKKEKLMEYWAGQSNKTTTAKTADPAPEIP